MAWELLSPIELPLHPSLSEITGHCHLCLKIPMPLGRIKSWD